MSNIQKKKRRATQCNRCGSFMDGDSVKCQKCGVYQFVHPTGLRPGDDGTILLSEADTIPVKRLCTGPWDINFGDPPGIAEVAVALIGGAPGVGKSTIALQWCNEMSKASKKQCLYLGAEEGRSQVKDRAVRLKCNLNMIRIVPMDLMHAANLESILAARHKELCGVVVDSMPGFTDDLEEAVGICRSFKAFAEQFKLPFIVIDHITKDGDMAGLMKLQHAVDICCLFTKGKKDEVCEVEELGDITEMRELYTEKNRFGPSGITTYYQMTAEGLIEVFPTGDEDEDD